jgi:hypothetical protein
MGSPCSKFTRKPLPSLYNRDDGFNIKLKDIMVMVVLWFSIQEHSDIEG